MELENPLTSISVAALRAAMDYYLPISEDIVRTERTYEAFFTSAVEKELGKTALIENLEHRSDDHVRDATDKLKRSAIRVARAAEIMLSTMNLHGDLNGRWHASITAAAKFIGLGTDMMKTMIENLYHYHILEVEKWSKTNYRFSLGIVGQKPETQMKLRQVLENAFQHPFSCLEPSARYLDWERLTLI